MICAHCGSEASFTVRGEVSEPLCFGCLDKAYTSLRLGSLTRQLVGDRKGGACPHCGWTAEKAKETGLVGCPLCYEALDASVWAEFGIHLVMR